MKNYLLILGLCILSTFVIYTNCNIEEMDEYELPDEIVEEETIDDNLEDYRVTVVDKNNPEFTKIYTFNKDNTYNEEEIFYFTNYYLFLEFADELYNIYYKSNDEMCIKTKTFNISGDYYDLINNLNYEFLEIIEDTHN